MTKLIRRSSREISLLTHKGNLAIGESSGLREGSGPLHHRTSHGAPCTYCSSASGDWQDSSDRWERSRRRCTKLSPPINSLEH